MHITGILAGKWPHSLSIRPGGSTTAPTAADKVKLLGLLQGFRQFLETVLFGDALERVAALDSAAALRRWADGHADSDFGRFLHLADVLALDRLGTVTPHFLSYGAYPLDGDHLFARGSWSADGAAGLEPARIREDISHSWMLRKDGPLHPFEGSTQPDPDMGNGYSWCKAPRYDGRVMEVGAQARQVVDGHPLLRDLVRSSGSNVQNRIVARLLELARIVPQMSAWVRQIEPQAPFIEAGMSVQEGEGAGMVEAARGSLGHWLRIHNGRILNYQIIAPTTWNFSPRDAKGRPGVLEQALVGTPVDEAGKEAVAIQHVVRSFDPCMVCTVH
jgi:hydrogenase large subunit